jgi:aminoglycoside N3'-acetyltransferase
MGAIADELRARPDTHLGSGRHRVCAWGADARRQVQGYAQLLAADGSVLLLGVGIDRCSSMHVAEARAGLPPEVAACAAVPGDILRDYPADRWYVQVGSTPVDAWGVVFAQACAAGLVTTGMVGAARCHLFAARAVVGLYEDRLRADPLALFGLASTPSPR